MSIYPTQKKKNNKDEEMQAVRCVIDNIPAALVIYTYKIQILQWLLVSQIGYKPTILISYN